ncbi:hypothetical protein SO694_00040046 [Aureococcus anophagefferens]|uniref:DNA-directed primase/polymerase protein n=1 Tax=Aureococcus anophagefferens TaxID=44056 RepID=A0ABR1G6V3_AURAN
MQSQRRDESSDDDEAWRAAKPKPKSAARPRKRTPLQRETFYEGAHGDAALAAWREESAALEARVEEARAARALGSAAIFAKQAWALEVADILAGRGAPEAFADDREGFARRSAARADYAFYGVDADNPVRLWAEEIGSEGQRRYVVAHDKAFRDLYDRSDARHYYELIREATPCRAYFDLEFAVAGNEALDGDDATRAWLATFADAVEKAFYAPTQLFREHAAAADALGFYDLCPDLDVQLRLELDGSPDLDAAIPRFEAAAAAAEADEAALYEHLAGVCRRRRGEPFSAVDHVDGVLQLDASTDSKFSRHCTFALPDGALFADAVALGGFVRGVLAASPKLRVVRGSDGGLETIVDASVYSRNRLFRLCGSTKRGKQRPLVVLPRGALAANAGDDVLPEASPSCPRRRRGSSGATAKRRRRSPPTRGAAARRSRGPAPARAAVGARRGPPAERFPAADAAVPGRPGAQVRKWERSRGAAANEGVLSYHLAKNRFCENVGREHRSNNIMLCVDLATSTWHQRCFDEGCRGFRSGERPLPDAAAGEIYDVLLDEATRDAEVEDRAKRRRTAPT